MNIPKYVPENARKAILEKARSKVPMTDLEKAVLIIIEVEDALAQGTKHYDTNGKLLTSVLEIITALRRDGEIQFEPNNGGQCAVRETKRI